MRYTFDIAKCDMISDYLLYEKQIKLPSNHVIPLPEQLKKHAYYNDCNVFCHQVQSIINKGRLKVVESPQIKLNKDSFPMNINMVKLEGKKVMVWPSQDESTKAKEVIIGEERQPRLINPKSPKDG
jgi:hypothetical protein